MKHRRPVAGLVYSTELGRTCPVCRRALGLCTCATSNAKVGDGKVKVGHTAKGRGGKTVTLVSGLALSLAEITALAGVLKRRCGTGGTVKDGTIEIQGEHRDAIIAYLATQDIHAKRTGG